MRLPHPGSFLSLLLLGAGFAGEPFRGGPRRIPGVVEAEDFDIDCLSFRGPEVAETMPRKP